MDSSRVPAPFLLQGAGRAAMQNREDLKRQVVAAVLIEDGVVNIRFNCPLANKLKKRCLALAKRQTNEGTLAYTRDAHH